MYVLSFGEPAQARRSVEQLRAIEGARVGETYKLLRGSTRCNDSRAIMIDISGTPRICQTGVCLPRLLFCMR